MPVPGEFRWRAQPVVFTAHSSRRTRARVGRISHQVRHFRTGVGEGRGPWNANRSSWPSFRIVRRQGGCFVARAFSGPFDSNDSHPRTTGRVKKRHAVVLGRFAPTTMMVTRPYLAVDSVVQPVQPTASGYRDDTTRVPGPVADANRGCSRHTATAGQPQTATSSQQQQPPQSPPSTSPVPSPSPAADRHEPVVDPVSFGYRPVGVKPEQCLQ